MLESLFNKVAGLQAPETPAQVFSYEYCERFKNTYYEENMRMAALGKMGTFFKNGTFCKNS